MKKQIMFFTTSLFTAYSAHGMIRLCCIARPTIRPIICSSSSLIKPFAMRGLATTAAFSAKNASASNADRASSKSHSDNSESKDPKIAPSEILRMNAEYSNIIEKSSSNMRKPRSKILFKILDKLSSQNNTISTANGSEPISVEIVELNNPEELQKAIDRQIEAKKAKLQETEKSTETMISWWESYVANESFTKEYSDRRKVLIAEATFWTVQIGLDKLFETMSYAQIRNFKPLAEKRSGSQLGKIIEAVCAKLVQPAYSHETSDALSHAALSVYVQKHGYKFLEQEENAYNNNR